MNCDAAIDLMLEADPAELRGEAPGKLRDHLATCGRCRLIAERLVEEQEMLRHVLEHVEPRLPVETALERATWSARMRRRRRMWLRVGPALAAASVAGVLLVSNQPGGPVGQPTLPTPEPTPVVQPPPGVDVALFETANPDIVVVWLY